MFVPSGKIVAQSSNNLGLWHDGMIAENGGIYNALCDVHLTSGGKVCC